jgi:hypothetical protein
MHPWELDGEQPRLHRNPVEYFLYRHGLRGFSTKLERLARALRFTSFREAYFGDTPVPLPRVSLSAL